MIKAKAVIRSSIGLHARPAANLANEAKRHQCSIKLKFDGKEADAKSLLQILTLSAGGGKEITVCADGPGEEEALRKIVEIIESADA